MNYYLEMIGAKKNPKNYFFLKKIGQPRPLFSIIFGLFKQTAQFLQQSNVKKSCSSFVDVEGTKGVKQMIT